MENHGVKIQVNMIHGESSSVAFRAIEDTSIPTNDAWFADGGGSMEHMIENQHWFNTF
jgi:hypothetical protein